MKLGLLADIHEQFESLRIALDRFRQEQVDRVVVIGDVFETGQRIESRPVICCWTVDATLWLLGMSEGRFAIFDTDTSNLTVAVETRGGNPC